MLKIIFLYKKLFNIFFHPFHIMHLEIHLSMEKIRRTDNNERENYRANKEKQKINEDTIILSKK